MTQLELDAASEIRVDHILTLFRGLRFVDEVDEVSAMGDTLSTASDD